MEGRFLLESEDAGAHQAKRALEAGRSLKRHLRHTTLLCAWPRWQTATSSWHSGRLRAHKAKPPGWPAEMHENGLFPALSQTSEVVAAPPAVLIPPSPSPHLLQLCLMGSDELISQGYQMGFLHRGLEEKPIAPRRGSVQFLPTGRWHAWLQLHRPHPESAGGPADQRGTGVCSTRGHLSIK